MLCYRLTLLFSILLLNSFIQLRGQYLDYNQNVELFSQNTDNQPYLLQPIIVESTGLASETTTTNTIQEGERQCSINSLPVTYGAFYL